MRILHHMATFIAHRPELDHITWLNVTWGMSSGHTVGVAARTMVVAVGFAEIMLNRQNALVWIDCNVVVIGVVAHLALLA
jgi:hypothetical protein